MVILALTETCHPCCEILFLQWSSTSSLIYPSGFFLPNWHPFFYITFSICQAECVLMYMVLCCPNFSLSVVDPLVLLCEFLLYQWFFAARVHDTLRLYKD